MNSTVKFCVALKLIVCAFFLALVVAGCASTSGHNGMVKVGPKPSSSFEKKQPDKLALALPKLDVIIHV